MDSIPPVILVTAGSAGLGAAVSRLFAQRGYRVAVNYSTNTSRAETLVTELCGTDKKDNVSRDHISGKTAHHFAIQADLASRKDIHRLVQETYSRMGRIDVVFSNGGWTRFSDTTSIDDNVVEDDWDRAFTMNVKSHLWLLHASKKYLDETEGAYITTSSVAGVRGMGSSLVGILSLDPIQRWLLTDVDNSCQAYAATKAAQIHMVRGLASMVAPKIRVNSISPGLLQTVRTIYL